MKIGILRGDHHYDDDLSVEQHMHGEAFEGSARSLGGLMVIGATADTDPSQVNDLARNAQDYALIDEADVIFAHGSSMTNRTWNLFVAARNMQKPILLVGYKADPAAVKESKAVSAILTVAPYHSAEQLETSMLAFAHEQGLPFDNDSAN